MTRLFSGRLCTRSYGRCLPPEILPLLWVGGFRRPTKHIDDFPFSDECEIFSDNLLEKLVILCDPVDAVAEVFVLAREIEGLGFKGALLLSQLPEMEQSMLPYAHRKCEQDISSKEGR